MKIAIVTPGSFALTSGFSSSVERVVYHECLHLMHQASLVVYGKREVGKPAVERIGEMTYCRIRSGGPSGFIKRTALRIAALRPDVIQVDNRPRHALYLKRRFPRIPLLLSLHSLTYISRPAISASESRQCLNAADAIMVNSEYLKTAISQIHPHCASKIKVNYLGVDPVQFIPRTETAAREQRERMQRQLGYEGKNIVLFVGRLQEIKGVHHMLDAVPLVIRPHPETIFLIVGSAFYGSRKVTDYVRRLHAAGGNYPLNVRFIPYVPHEQIHLWYQLADIVIVPSFTREAFGLVNVEAMATGAPVIATRSGGLREVVEEGKTGILIDPANVKEELAGNIIKLLDDRELLEDMGRQSVERVMRHFTWERHAAELLEIYRSLSPQPSAGRLF